MTLLGKSAAQAALGFDSTLPAKMGFLFSITAAVKRGDPHACLASGGLSPFYQAAISDAILTAWGLYLPKRALKQSRWRQAALLLDVIRAVNNADIAVMAHSSQTKSGELEGLNKLLN